MQFGEQSAPRRRRLWVWCFVGRPSTPASLVFSPPTRIAHPLCSRRGPWWMTEPAMVNCDRLMLENHEQPARQGIRTIPTSTNRLEGKTPLHTRQSCGTGCYDETYFAYEANWWEAGLWVKAKTNGCGKPNEWIDAEQRHFFEGCINGSTSLFSNITRRSRTVFRSISTLDPTIRTHD